LTVTCSVDFVLDVIAVPPHVSRMNHELLLEARALAHLPGAFRSFQRSNSR
jgi:hypothetical protein